MTTNNCTTCDGIGVVNAYAYPEALDHYEPTECPECQGIGLELHDDDLVDA